MINVNSLLDLLARMARQHHLVALRDGVISAVPIILVGSTFLLVGSQADVVRKMLPDSVQQWELVKWYLGHEAVFFVPYRLTMSILSLYVAFTIAASLAKQYNLPPVPNALGAVAAFIMTVLPVKVVTPAAPKGEWVISLAGLGPGALFLAIICAFGTIELSRLINRPSKEVRDDGPEDPMGVPRAVGDAFRTFLPMLIAVTVVWSLRDLAGVDLSARMVDAMKPMASLGDTLACVILVNIALHLMQFAGVHGVSVINAVFLTFWQVWLASNAEAHLAGLPLPHVTAYPFYQWFIWIGGAGTTLPLALLLLRSRHAHGRHIGRISIIPSLFNVNEPLIFGFPVVLNPVMAVPFVLAPTVCGVLAWFAISWGWVGRPFIEVPWVLPCFLGAPLSCGDSRALVLLGVNLVVAGLIWYPFLRAWERNVDRKNDEEAAAAVASPA